MIRESSRYAPEFFMKSTLVSAIGSGQLIGRRSKLDAIIEAAISLTSWNKLSGIMEISA